MAEDDVRLDISAVDRGAARLVRGVADALRALSSTQAQQAQTTRQVAAAARTASDALSQQARFARAAAADEQNRLRTLQETTRARIAAIRTERDEAVNAAKVIARAQEEVAKGFVKAAQERVRQARTLARIDLPGGGTASTAGTPAALAARRRELAVANENLARARALGRQQIIAARQVGVAEEQAARQVVRAQREILLAKQRTARESLRAATQADRDARIQERAALRAEAAFRRQATSIGAVNRTAQALRNTVLRLVAAYGGFRAIEGFIGAGLRFNQVIESSRLGIGALITAQTELFDTQGRLLTGTTALAAAQVLAEDQLTKLRIAGIQTAATTEDLVTSFEEAVGAGLAVGLTLDQIRRFSVSVAQAASAIHLPMNQLQQETRSILQGTIDRNSRIAKALQLTNEEIRLAKEQNRLAELLEDKFRAFNIAGAESVKTFGALRSNIADAFAVFTGLATKPLFEQLRDAGVSALQEIFDFRSADIAASFRGLIEGLQALFKEIGALFANSIRSAVDNAKSLSEWLVRNREEVKQTAQALRTMVEDFGTLISSVVSAIGAFGSMAGAINPVIGLARILSSLFQTIAENIKLIIGLLTARALVTAIGSIVTAVAAIRAVATGATIGSAAGPIGTAVGGTIGLILGLGTAYKLLRGDERAATLETARMTTALQDQTQQAVQLFGTIESLNRQLQAQGLSADETRQLTEQRAAALEQLSALEGDYGRVIRDQNLTLEEKRTKLLELLETQRAQAEFQATNATIELENLRRQAQAARIAVPTGAAAVANPAVRGRLKAAAEEAEAALAAQEERTKTLREAYLRLQSAIQEALRTPARIQFTGRTTTDAANKDINDAVQRAKADLERIRAINEGLRTGIQADLKAGVLAAIDVIEIERDLMITELDAEQKVAEAQRAAAEKRVIGKKVVPDQGAIDAAEITLEQIAARRELIEQETQDRIREIVRQNLDARARIEEDFLRVTGGHLAAARAEIERKHREQLRIAIREFGADSPIVMKLRIVIEQQQIREQAEAIQAEIRRIVQLRDAQIAAARAIIEVPGARGRGRLTAQQQQLLADQISAANARAVASTEGLRQQLIQLRDSTLDPLLQTFIDSLLQQLDTLKVKAREVDLELKRLKESVAEAFVGGISGFLDDLTDKTKKFADSFRDMVRNILQDISRLVSRLIAERIVFSILGVGAAEGGRAGNLTQAEGRAEGGLGRPQHGLLKGGWPGVDSIHIAAQPDEYFTKPRAVRYYGVELFDALNNMELPRMNPRSFKTMAFGGQANEGIATARPTQKQVVEHTLVIDDDGLIRVMKGRFGRDITLGHIHRNPRTVGAALRGRRS